MSKFLASSLLLSLGALGFGCARFPAAAQKSAAVTPNSEAMATEIEWPNTTCIQCHKDATEGIARDFLAGEMGHQDMDCADCHGDAHQSAEDADKAELPTQDTCGACHDDRLEEYMEGKHAKGWIAMEAMPTAGLQPHPYIQGKKGCGGCHKMGVRDDESRQKGRYGTPCNNCHTRHRFSRQEALRPEACRTCHMGFDHPQWEMWSSSKHGVIFLSEGGSSRAPSCQTCHMPDGNHGVKTAWGFLGLRLPEDDKEWLADRTTILKALRVLDPKGNPTPRFEAVKAADMVRLTKEDWQAKRDEMLDICARCHSRRFAEGNMEAGDQMLREADTLMAEAIDIVTDLYRKKILEPADPKNPYPDLLTFYDTGTLIEQTLWVMFLEHRMRTFQGAFHMNPDYVTWYGLAAMKKDLVYIKTEAARLRTETK